jgi:transposase
MDIVHERSVGMDISKRDAKVCISVQGKRRGQFTSTVTTWGSTANQILELRRFLEEQDVTVVVMKAASDYLKPFYYLLEGSLPVNARHARNLPGRARPMFPTRHGWRNLARTGCCGPRLFRPGLSANCGI